MRKKIVISFLFTLLLSIIGSVRPFSGGTYMTTRPATPVRSTIRPRQQKVYYTRQQNRVRTNAPAVTHRSADGPKPGQSITEYCQVISRSGQWGGNGGAATRWCGNFQAYSDEAAAAERNFPN